MRTVITTNRHSSPSSPITGTAANQPAASWDNKHRIFEDMLWDSINVFLPAEPRKIIWDTNVVIPVPADDLAPPSAGPSMRTVMTTNRHSWSFSLILPYLSTLSDRFPPTADSVQLLLPPPSLLLPGITNIEYWRALLRESINVFLPAEPRKIIWDPNSVIPMPVYYVAPPHRAGPSMMTVMTTDRHSWPSSLILSHLSILSDRFDPTADRVQLLAEPPSLLPPGITNII